MSRATSGKRAPTSGGSPGQQLRCDIRSFFSLFFVLHDFTYLVLIFRAHIFSDRYNNERRVQTIKYAMIEQLRHPPAGFEDVVALHFSILGPSIVEQCERYHD